MKLPESKLYILTNAEDEAAKIQEKIKNKEAKDYSEAEKIVESEKEDRQYLTYFQDYANKIWSMAAHFSYDCENDIEKFRKYIQSKPLPKIEDCYDDKDGLIKNCKEKIDILNNIIAKINSIDDEATFKRLINTALFLIYPDRGRKQEYKENEFNADEINMDSG